MSDIKHGEERNREIKRKYSNFSGSTPSGEISFDYVSSERTVCEKYCAFCNEWIEVDGIGGFIIFICTHGDKDSAHHQQR